MSAMQQDSAAAAAATAPQPDVRAPPSGVRFGSLLPLGVKGGWGLNRSKAKLTHFNWLEINCPPPRREGCNA